MSNDNRNEFGSFKNDYDICGDKDVRVSEAFIIISSSFVADIRVITSDKDNSNDKWWWSYKDDNDNKWQERRNDNNLNIKNIRCWFKRKWKKTFLIIIAAVLMTTFLQGPSQLMTSLMQAPSSTGIYLKPHDCYLYHYSI